jgi:hypothetical protein
MHFGGTANSAGSGFRKADKADFSFLHQFGHAADRFFDRHVRIDAMLVKQVDRVNAKPLQRSLASPSGVLRATIYSRRRVSIPAHRELGGDHQAVAPTFDGGADKLLVAKRPVHLGGVEKGNAEVDRLMNRSCRDVVVGHAVLDVAVTDHRHAADTNC